MHSDTAIFYLFVFLIRPPLASTVRFPPWPSWALHRSGSLRLLSAAVQCLGMDSARLKIETFLPAIADVSLGNH